LNIQIKYGKQSFPFKYDEGETFAKQPRSIE